MQPIIRLAVHPPALRLSLERGLRGRSRPNVASLGSLASAIFPTASLTLCGGSSSKFSMLWSSRNALPPTATTTFRSKVFQELASHPSFVAGDSAPLPARSAKPTTLTFVPNHLDQNGVLAESEFVREPLATETL
jgi:hypothetical protein